MAGLDFPRLTNPKGSALVLVQQDGELYTSTVAEVRGQSAPALAATFSADKSSAAPGDVVTLSSLASGGYPGYVTRFYVGDPAAGGQQVGSPVATGPGEAATFQATAGTATTSYHCTVADQAGTVLARGPVTVTVSGGSGGNTAPPADEPPFTPTMEYTP